MLKARLVVPVALIAWGGLVTADAAVFTKEQDCIPGMKVVDREKKTGTVVSVSRRMCRVLLDETGTERSYLFWTLRAAGASRSTDDKPASPGRR